MAKGGGGGGGGGGSGGAGGRSAGGGGGAAASAPLTGAEAAKELKSLGFTEVSPGHILEKALTDKFGKMPTSEQLKQLTGMSQISKSDVESGHFEVYANGSIRIELSARGIDMKRTLQNRTGETKVYHDHLFLSPRLQGTGLGKRIVRDQVRAYRGLNVKQVDLFAAEVGRYAWPKMGFNADRKGVIAAKREFARYLRKQNVAGAAAIVRSAKTLHDIATTRVDGKKVGKSFFLQGRNRDMSLRLDPKDKGFQTFQREVDL